MRREALRPAPDKLSSEKQKEALYRSRQVTGLLIVASLVLAFALARANWHNLFPTGWWRAW
jgi:hypothetical protein